jgi:hypothetical protein
MQQPPLPQRELIQLLKNIFERNSSNEAFLQEKGREAGEVADRGTHWNDFGRLPDGWWD